LRFSPLNKVGLEIAPEIEAVLKQMDSLRSHFDGTPPNVGLREWFDQRVALRQKLREKFYTTAREGQTSGKYDDTPVQLDHAHDCPWDMLQSSDDDTKLTAAYAAMLEELADLDVEYEELWKPRFTDLQLE
jgi:hypothetical protein